MSAKKKILAVDDDALSLGALRQILVQKGYEVLVAHNGQQALALLDSSSFDLFILDVAMPGMSGYDLCRRIRARPETENTPVIFLTAKALLMDIAEGQDAGSDLYLIKPIMAAKLLNMVGLFLTSDSPLTRRRRPATPTA